MIATLIAKAKAWALTILVALSAVSTAFILGRRKGRQSAEDKANTQDLERQNNDLARNVNAAEERRHVEDEIDRAPAGSAADRLREHWSDD